MDPRNLKAGQLVDTWRVVRRLGGTHGVVYEVEREGERLALKLACPPDGGADPHEAKARGRRESVCLLRIRHPNIVCIRAVGHWPDPSEGMLYLVLDLVEGETLGEWAERKKPTPHEVTVLMAQALDALEHMHKNGVFHRNPSLRHLRITPGGELVITGFGAAIYSYADALKDEPLVHGTPRNWSPEAARFWRDSPRAAGECYPFRAVDELFALGASFYDVLTEPRPTVCEQRPPLGSEVFSLPSPFTVGQGRVPQELSDFIMKLIAHRPEERFQTAREAKQVAQKLARHQGEAWRGITVHP
jgi:serine/threonine protein kinase